MSSKTYESWGVDLLKKECMARKIKGVARRKYISRNRLIVLLEKNDRKASSCILPTPYIDEEDKPIVNVKMDPPSTKDMLVVGLGTRDVCDINKERALFTGIKNEESLPWRDIVVGKKVQEGSFSVIFVFRPELFCNVGGTLDPRKTCSILSTLKKDGDVYVIKYNDFCTRIFIKHLTDKGYELVGSQKSTGTKKEFSIYHKNKDCKKIPKSLEKPFPVVHPIEIDEDEPKKFLPPIDYTLLKLDFCIEEQHSSGSELCYTGITLDEFRKELESPKFIEAFTLSIRRLMAYKCGVYHKYLAELKKEHGVMYKKIQKLISRGVNKDAITKIYPTYETITVSVVEIEELIQNIESKIEFISIDQTKKNLLEALDHSQKGFASIVGREDVKNSIACQLYSFSKSYKTFINSFNNMCFMGPAGSGKTALAKVIAFVFSKSGILVRDTIKIVSRSDLVGRYVGHTAPLTKGILMGALESVLFIDEAYQLAPVTECNDFGSEAITEIVNFLDKFIGLNMVIVAGYEGLMKGRFFPSNEGLSRRFPYKLVLPKYTIQELTNILIGFINDKSDACIRTELANYLFSVISYFEDMHPGKNIFSNQAGDMLNLGSIIMKTINSSYSIKWEDENLGNSIMIIKRALDEYLNMKGLAIKQKD